MPIQTRSRDGVHILELQGDFTLGPQIARPLDLTGRPVDDLLIALDRLLEQGAAKILLDLGAVNFMDSAGLGRLVACKKRAILHGGDIRILRPSRRVRELLEITLLDRVFEIFDDETAAVTAAR